MNFLQARLGPFPVWVWGGIVIAGVGVFFLVKHFQSSGTPGGTTLGQNTAGQVSPLNPNNDPSIDPNTGVPYQIEEGIDPNTGLPYYFELTNGASSPGQAGGGPQGPTAPLPPAIYGPPPGPPITPSPAPVVTPGSSSMPGVVAAKAGPTGPDRPPQPSNPPSGSRPPTGPDRPPQPSGTPTRPPTGPDRPPQPVGSGSDEWAYPFWAGQGGSLYTRG